MMDRANIADMKSIIFRDKEEKCFWQFEMIFPRRGLYSVSGTQSWNIQHFRSWFGLTFNGTESVASPGQLEDPGEFEHPEHLEHPLQVVLLLLHQVGGRHQKTEQKIDLVEQEHQFIELIIAWALHTVEF